MAAAAGMFVITSKTEKKTKHSGAVKGVAVK